MAQSLADRIKERAAASQQQGDSEQKVRMADAETLKKTGKSAASA